MHLGRKGRVFLTAVVLFAALLAPTGPARAIPVCTDGYMGGAPRALCGGRIFPEAALARGYVQYLADPTGLAEYQHGIEYMAELYPRWISVFTLRDLYGDQAVSAGPDRIRPYAPNDTGDGKDIWVIKITDHEVPDEGKDTLFFSLSVHGNERGGLEGGLRTAEDLAIAAETGEGEIVDGYENFESTTGREPELHAYPVAEVLEKQAVYLTAFNIDGWAVGDIWAPTPNTYARGNSLGTDLNRQMPTIGRVNQSRNPLQESEMLYGHKLMHEVAEQGPNGKMAYGADIHGELTSQAYTDIMYPAGQFDSVDHRRLMAIAERTKSVIDETLFAGIIDEIEALTGGDQAEAEQNAIPTKPAHWATVWDTLGYTDTGFIGDYMATDLGVTGMDYEIFLNHTVPDKVWNVYLQENHITATRAMIKTAMAYTLFQEEEFNQDNVVIDPVGRAGYVFNPDPVTDTDENGPGRLPGPSANGIGQNGEPVEQRPYSATNMRWFEDTSRLTPEGLVKVLPGDIAADPTSLNALDTLVLPDNALPRDAADREVDAAAYYGAIRDWVERGGNLVLTDRALHTLGELELVEPDAIQNVNVYQPYANIRDFDHAMVEGLRPNARQLVEAATLGYGIGNNASPMTVVSSEAWEAAGGHIVATTGNNAGTSDNQANTSIGELGLGDGQIRIVGGALPTPTEENDHRYGLRDYALTYTGLFIMENSIVHDFPGLGEVPDPDEVVATVLAFTDDSATSGEYSDEVTLQARLTDEDGGGIADQAVTFSLTDDEDSIAGTWTETTGASGIVTVPARLLVEPGEYTLTARYDGALEEFEPSEVSAPFTVLREQTELSAEIVGQGSNMHVSATLADHDPEDGPIAGRLIEFFANGDAIGSALTDGSGVASIAVPPGYRGKNNEFLALFDGDAFYLGSEATTRR